MIRLKSGHRGDPKAGVLTKGDPGAQARREGDDGKTRGGTAVHSPRRSTAPPPAMSRPREAPALPTPGLGRLASRAAGDHSSGLTSAVGGVRFRSPQKRRHRLSTGWWRHQQEHLRSRNGIRWPPSARTRAPSRARGPRLLRGLWGARVESVAGNPVRNGVITARGQTFRRSAW